MRRRSSATERDFIQRPMGTIPTSLWPPLECMQEAKSSCNWRGLGGGRNSTARGLQEVGESLEMLRGAEATNPEHVAERNTVSRMAAV